MTAATTSGPASADALGATSGEVADRLRLAMARLGRRLVHTHPDAGMTPSRLTALGALEAAGPLRIGGLAEILGTSPPTTSRLVEVLYERGLVTRTPDPDDHRATRIALTAEGAALLHALRRCTTDALARRIDDLTVDRRAALVAALPVLEEIALPADTPRRVPACNSPRPRDGPRVLRPGCRCLRGARHGPVGAEPWLRAVLAAFAESVRGSARSSRGPHPGRLSTAVTTGSARSSSSRDGPA